jgi:hypothetical protein
VLQHEIVANRAENRPAWDQDVLRAESMLADLSVSDNGGASPQQVSLSGTAECGGSCFTGCKGTGCKCLAGRCLALGSADFLQQSPFEPNGANSAACGSKTAAKSSAPPASTSSR